MVIKAGLIKTMPEEINHIVTDAISDYFFVTEESGVNNLIHEGRPKDSIHFVGNVMIDNLFFQKKMLESDNGKRFSTFRLKQEKREYIFLTLHRPSNVDFSAISHEIATALNKIAEPTPIFFPAHPEPEK